ITFILSSKRYSDVLLAEADENNSCRPSLDNSHFKKLSETSSSVTITPIEPGLFYIINDFCSSCVIKVVGKNGGGDNNNCNNSNNKNGDYNCNQGTVINFNFGGSSGSANIGVTKAMIAMTVFIASLYINMLQLVF
ncbi:4524_t:CDS:2, partial [Funneliformis caledonium]